MKYWDIQDKAEKGTFITFESHREAQNWLDRETVRYPERVNRNGMHIVECERQTLYEKYTALQKESEAMRAALKHARETLITLNTLGGLGFDKHRWIDEALATIDKAVEE